MSLNEIKPETLSCRDPSPFTSDSEMEEIQTKQMMNMIFGEKGSKLSKADKIVSKTSKGKKKEHVQKAIVKESLFASTPEEKVKSESLIDSIKIERADRVVDQSQRPSEKVNQSPSVIQTVLGTTNSAPSRTSNPDIESKLDRTEKYLAAGLSTDSSRRSHTTLQVYSGIFGNQGGASRASTASKSSDENNLGREANIELSEEKIERAEQILHKNNIGGHSSHSNKQKNIKATLLNMSSSDQGLDPELGNRLGRADNILKSHNDLAPSAAKSGKHSFGIMAQIIGDPLHQKSNSDNSDIDSKLRRAENAIKSDSLRAADVSVSHSHQNIKVALLGSIHSSENASPHDQIQASSDSEADPGIREKLERADHLIRISSLKAENNSKSTHNIKASLLGRSDLNSTQLQTEMQPEVEDKINRADVILKKESLAPKTHQKIKSSTSQGVKASIIGLGHEKKESSNDPDLQKKMERAEKSLKVADKAPSSGSSHASGRSIKTSLMTSSKPSPTSSSTSKLDIEKKEKSARAEKVMANSKTPAAPSKKNDLGTKSTVINSFVGSMSNLLGNSS